MKYIYIIETSTPSKFGKIIRFMTNATYNHISVSLNKDLEPIYAFARKYNKIPIDGGLVKEHLKRFNLGKDIVVKTQIFKIPINDNTYKKIENIIKNIENDNEYIYNLYSALSYPLFGGFHTYKSFTCVEFGAYILKQAGFNLSKEPHNYTPEELGNELMPYLYYKGNLCDYRKFKYGHIYNENFFSKQPYRLIFYKSFKVIKTLTKRNFKNMYKSYPSA